MKRSPLRRTPMKRGKSQLKRAPIKPKPRRGGAMPQASYDAVMMRAGYRCEAQLPVLLSGRTWMLLNDDGGMRPAGAVDDRGRAPEVIG